VSFAQTTAKADREIKQTPGRGIFVMNSFPQVSGARKTSYSFFALCRCDDLLKMWCVTAPVCRGWVETINKQSLTLVIATVGGTTGIREVDSMFAFVVSLFVPGLVDFEIGLTKCYRIHFADRDLRLIAGFSDFFWPSAQCPSPAASMGSSRRRRA
jgi:hypothetical protein